MASATRLESRASERQPQEASQQIEWHIVTDIASNDPDAAYAVAGCPKVGTPHPDNAGYFCERVRSQNIEGSLFDFVVTAQYAMRPYRRPVDPTNTPASEPPNWRWVTAHRKIASERDYYGNPYVNSAGKPFKARELDSPGTTLLYRRYELWGGAGLPNAYNYVKCINTSPWNGFPAFCVLLWDIVADLVWSQTGATFYRFEYEFHIALSRLVNVAQQGPVFVGGWITVVQDAGLYDFAGKRLPDADGKDTVEDQLLNGNGAAFVPASEPNGPYYILFRDFQEINFGPLQVVLS